ncbi:MAG TPA: alpha/beta hydrolase [Streptosporangiaceae bacterium]
MGLITDIGGAAEGYEAVSLPLLTEDPTGTQGLDGAVLRRRSARPTKRAVIYLHCLDDPFVPAGLASWYTDRGFHFYVADLRRLGDTGPTVLDSAAEVSAYFACLDMAAQHVRDADGMETVVVGAHDTGALVAALWCHARRGGSPADALILASPAFGAGSWLARLAVGRHRAAPLLAVLRRRVRRGLDISCPVLVLCPATDWDATGGSSGLLPRPGLAGGHATMRLGPHVTWRKVDEASPARAGLGQLLDEQGRWLGAYLSSQIRDQLLLSGGPVRSPAR